MASESDLVPRCPSRFGDRRSNTRQFRERRRPTQRSPRRRARGDALVRSVRVSVLLQRAWETYCFGAIVERGVSSEPKIRVRRAEIVLQIVPRRYVFRPQFASKRFI